MTQIKAPDTFYSVSSISNWAGVKNGVLWIDLGIVDTQGKKLDNPYVEKDGLYYYFGLDKTHVYSLICTSERDLGAN